MTCREFVEFLISYIDGNLETAPRDVFEAHMRLCPPCGDYLETYRDTIRLGKFACREEEGSPPEDVPEELIQAILAARNVA